LGSRAKKAAKRPIPHPRGPRPTPHPAMTVMELRVESSEGCSMPPGCFIGVRIGDVQKQGRYEPQRCYNFEQVDRRKNAKIDIYQHVGSCIVGVDPDVKSIHEVKVMSTDPAFTGLRLNVNVRSKRETEPVKPPRAERVIAMKNKAKEYLVKHCIEERLSEAVKAILKHQPDDPTEFLCRHIRDGAAQRAPPAQVANTAAVPQPGPQASAVRHVPIVPFASYYREHFTGSELTKALRRFPAATRPVPRSDADTIRSHVKKRFAEASSSGQLRTVMEQRKMAHLREKACQLLVRASEDCNLLSILESVKVDQAKARGQSSPETPAQAQDLKFLKQTACRVLVQASEDGVLEKSLAEVWNQHPSEMTELRKRAALVLKTAQEDGSLKSVLAECTGKGEPPGLGKEDAVRMETAALLFKAAASGELSAALSQLSAR